MILEGTSFMYMKHTNIFLVAATRGNPNVSLIFEFLTQKLRILKSYLGDKFTDENVQANFTLLYELLDETMDYGYPQNSSIDVLKLMFGTKLENAAPGKSGAALTSQITGAIDWRREGIRYRKNEVYIDVHEIVTLLTSSTGVVLRAEIQGVVKMKASLSGMPECKFGLNDKLIMEKEGGAAAVAANQKASGVEIDDCTFHRCVRLGKFETDRTITFIPPDGEFDLMKYRVNSPSQPFRLFPTYSDEGKTKLVVSLKVSSDFPDDKKATLVSINIPVPPTTANTRISASRGRAKYEPGKGSIVWRISNFPGMSEANITCIVDLLPNIREKPWVRQPISVNFEIPMYSASGVQVRFLKVFEMSSYTTQRWVRYLSKAGDYQMRL